MYCARLNSNGSSSLMIDEFWIKSIQRKELMSSFCPKLSICAYLTGKRSREFCFFVLNLGKVEFKAKKKLKVSIINRKYLNIINNILFYG